MEKYQIFPCFPIGNSLPEETVAYQLYIGVET